MEIGKYMKRNVISIPETSSIREAASVFVKHHVGLLPIVDQHRKLIGVVGLRDLLRWNSLTLSTSLLTWISFTILAPWKQHVLPGTFSINWSKH